MRPEELESLILQKKSFLCVGLDPDVSRFPVCLKDKDPIESVIEFNRNIIQATLPYAVAYKPNFAFYESLGSVGHTILTETLSFIPEDIFVIADAKRGDIGNTSSMYSQAVFDLPGVNAITVAPYMGKDSVLPFLQKPNHWVFVLALTSNPGSQDFQYLECNGKKLYEWVMEKSLSWSVEMKGTIGFVVGATHSGDLFGIKKIAPDSFFLVPGVGAQGGDLEAVLKYLAPKVLINVGRQILYASTGADYAEAAAKEARNLHSKFADFFEVGR
jgi:orotidine-5'-phosphate decarboxylase